MAGNEPRPAASEFRAVEVKMIFLDAVGTLFHLPRGVGFHYCDVLSRFGFEVPAEQLDRAFRLAWKEQPAPSVTQIARPDDDRGWWRQLVDRVFATCGVDGQAFDQDAMFLELYGEFSRPGVWELFPETVEVLAVLAARFPLGIITNFDGRFHQISRHLRLTDFFKTVTVSSEVGADKPDPWIFRQALQAAGVRAAEALHVGDDPACDWQGAEAAGLQVFRLRRPENDLRDLLRLLQ